MTDVPAADGLPGGRASPMLQQYFGVKRQYPEALLFFRMGDFFELFFEDARVAARVLGIALTSRSKEQEIPMAGVPVRTVDAYLRRLIAAGHTVVVCDQVEDPKQAKGLVDRQVTRIVTPGTILEDALLEGGRHNFVAALQLERHPGASDSADAGAGATAALAWLDLSTGRFEAASFGAERLRDELARLAPAELLLPAGWKERPPAEAAFLVAARDEGPALAWRPDHEFSAELGRKALCEQFRVGDLAGFGLEPDDPVIAPAAALLHYARETQRGAIDHVARLRRRAEAGAMRLDRAAVQALELFETTRERRREGSLLAVVDRTRTAAGARLLRDWLGAPLTAPPAIAARHDAVAELREEAARREALRQELAGIFDLERIVARLAANRGGPRDLAQLRDSLLRLPAAQAGLAAMRAAALRSLSARLVAPPGLVELLARAIDDAPPLATREGGFIRAGFDAGLDELRRLRFDVQAILADLQRRECERSGIPTLKVGFNSVFGYYLEITHAQRERVPADYIRKQTLKNAERYITPELKELEARVLSAEERSIRLELELFEQVRREAASRIRPLQELAAALAELDVLQGFAEAAREHGFARPDVDDSRMLEIDEGRHPVLAATLPPGSFVPNDTRLDGDGARFALITGPNMAGKSTWLRQNALIVLLAQAGSFVPARRARIGAVDRIFTRVGASDDLSRGASTFMVEMAETANVLHHATDRSLVVLDEVGRGTGTFDGMSLARALCEHLAEKVRCRTLFATHYHQLTQLAEELPAVVNLSVAVREWGEEILFLHRIVAGGTDRSYGLHVARLAGIPTAVIERAKQLLADLDRLTPEVERRSKRVVEESTGAGAAIVEDRAADRVARELRRLEVERLTPLQALTRLAELKQLAQGETPPPSRAKAARHGSGGPSLFGG